MSFDMIFDVLKNEAPTLVGEHLFIVLVSLGISIAVALPLGILLTRKAFRPHENKIIAVLNTAQGVPSLAVIAIFLKVLGIGLVPSIFALSLRGLLPIAQNTVAGINNVDSGVVESARGMGMPKFQVLTKVELPLALPIIIAGIQTSAVLIVGTAAIAQLIGAGGLGKLIFTGISQFRPELTIIGASLAALMAITFDKGLGALKTKLTKHYN